MANPNLDLYARPQTLVRINSRRRLNLLRTGAGQPTVILAHGWGGSTLEWARVQPLVSRFATVIAYDRAGFGFSASAPLPRTTDRILADLRAALIAFGAKQPFVLVSHSAGNYEMRLFAFRHPEEVAGMVLVDPGGDDWGERSRVISPLIKTVNDAARARLKMFEAWAREGRLVPGSPEFENCVRPPNPLLPDAVNDAVRGRQLKPAYWRACYAEECAISLGGNDRCLAAARRSLGDLPLIVLTAGARFDAAENPSFTSDEIKAATRLWTTFHEEYASLSSRGVRREVSGCGHAIHIERPDVVVEAIRDVIAMAGGIR
jgi:pimeloyl-ACP methyl ester carboxylesterase